MSTIFTPANIEKNFFVDSINAEKRGQTFSVRQMFGSRVADAVIGNTKVHDANFAFLTTTLAKVHQQLHEPTYFVTYQEDIPINVGGGFVDFVTYYTVDWAGIMNEFRNVVGNNANYIPRVNASMTQNNAKVYTWEVAYDLRFIELEKMKKLTLQKSIQDIYQNAITAGWDLFCQAVAYTGINGGNGLFNSNKVYTTTIDNTGASAANVGFRGMTDDAIVAFFNGVFEYYLGNSNMNLQILPNVFLVPSFVASDLTSRMNTLYTNTLRKFIIDHNLGTEESGEPIEIKMRPALNTLGAGSHGRVVAYRKHESFVRLDIPYPMQHYITMPNIDKMSYTSAFAGQVSEIQLPYNENANELGVVTYWDFTK